MALAALVALTLLRLVLAARLPLVPDEAYYWVWSRALAPGYPDHPPMVALWIRLGTLLVGDTPLGIRLLGPISIAIASLLLADAADRLFRGQGAGIRAAGLLNATLLFGVGSLLMTPDAPLLTFWIATLWAAVRLLDSEDPHWWLAIGLFSGLAALSKYTAALLWLGIVIWMLITPRMWVWVRRREPWFGAALGLAMFLPVLVWDAGHGWASLARQGGRVAAWDPTRAIQFVAELIGGQVGLITPLVFVLFAAGTGVAVRRAWQTREPEWTLLAALTLPGTLLFAQHALGDRVQGNWPAIIYPAAAIAAGALTGRRWQRLWVPAVGLGFGLTALAYLAGLQPLPLAVSLDPIARQLAGWDTLAAELDAIRRRAGADFILADQYGVAAELALALPPRTPVVGFEPRWAQFDLPPADLVGKTGILVRSGRRNDLDEAGWSKVAELDPVTRRRGDDIVEIFLIFRVSGTRNVASAVLLPRPH